MKIDDCGVFSKNLRKMLEDFIENEKKDGKEVTQYEINTYDTALFNAYENVKSISQNEEVLVNSINELQQLMNAGNINISDFPKIATSVTNEVSKEFEKKMAFEDTAKNVVENVVVPKVVATATASVTVAMANSYMSDKALINSMCTEKMENLHKKTYEKAKNGDEKATIELDLIRKASNYILNKDRLNPKGKEAGALALISQLIKLDSPEAGEMAQRLVNEFGIRDVTQDGVISGEMVRNRLQEKKQGIDIDKIEENCAKNALKRRETVLATSSSSYRQETENLAERKKIIRFLQEYGKAIASNREDLAEEFVNSNPVLAQKALYVQKRIYETAKKKDSNVEKAKIKTQKLGEMVQKSKTVQHMDNKLQEDER